VTWTFRSCRASRALIASGFWCLATSSRSWGSRVLLQVNPAIRGEDGRLFITPECTSFKEVEGQLNSLQDELDEIRERARRAFQVT
jgi:hypothetical protein